MVFDPEEAIRTLAALAAEADSSPIADEARALAQRTGEGRFHVACVGEFKRGKSTLLNALVGKEILPTGVVPVTTVVTVLRHGPRPCARVRLEAGDTLQIDPGEIATYVSENENPGNAKGVAAVEVCVPSPLLESGMCLVDTPGIGSVFAANTAATRAFVPHIDAGLVVLGGDPPISGDELALVEEVAREVPHLIFVLNKADRLTEPERREATAFTERVLADRLHRPVGAIFEVSALEQLTAAGPERDWGALCAALERLARESGASLVAHAQARGIRRLADRLLQLIEEERGALSRPLEESLRRVEAMRACTAQAERALKDLGYLLNAEQDGMRDELVAHRDEFLERALPAVRRHLHDALYQAAPRRGPRLRRRAVDLAQEMAKRWLDPWLGEEAPRAEERYRQATRRFAELANDFLERLASSGEPALSGLPRAVSEEGGFRAKSRLYYTELLTYTSQTPGAWLFDLFRGRERALRAIERDVGEYLEYLLTTNSARIQNDLVERVLESRRRLEGEIRRHLHEVRALAEHALARARSTRAAGAPAVEAEMARLDALRQQLEALQVPETVKEKTR